jgi:pyruvate dehydrogenase E1 component
MANDPRADIDPIESEEWIEAINSVIKTHGVERAQYLLQRLSSKVTETGAQLPYAINTPYRNTIPVSKEARMPGDLFLERSLRSVIPRWAYLDLSIQRNTLRCWV